MPRRSGLINAADPISGDAGFTAVLTGKNFTRQGRRRDPDDRRGHSRRCGRRRVRRARSCARRCRRSTAPRRPTSPTPRALKPMVLPMIAEGDHGPAQPARPVRRPRRDGEGRRAAAARRRSGSSATPSSTSATSPEGRAGMRFFFTQQAVQKLPKGFPGKPRTLKKIGVDGADGYMGNAIAWLALEAGYEVVGARAAAAVRRGGAGEARRQVRPGGEEGRDERGRRREARSAASASTTDIADALRLRPRHRGAHGEPRDQGASSTGRSAHGMKADGLVASNSSSMGPGPARRRLRRRRRRRCGTSSTCTSSAPPSIR